MVRLFHFLFGNPERPPRAHRLLTSQEDSLRISTEVGFGFGRGVEDEPENTFGEESARELLRANQTFVPAQILTVASEQAITTRPTDTLHQEEDHGPLARLPLRPCQTAPPGNGDGSSTRTVLPSYPLRSHRAQADMIDAPPIERIPDWTAAPNINSRARSQRRGLQEDDVDSDRLSIVPPSSSQHRRPDLEDEPVPPSFTALELHPILQETILAEYVYRHCHNQGQHRESAAEERHPLEQQQQQQQQQSLEHGLSDLDFPSLVGQPPALTESSTIILDEPIQEIIPPENPNITSTSKRKSYYRRTWTTLRRRRDVQPQSSGAEEAPSNQTRVPSIEASRRQTQDQQQQRHRSTKDDIEEGYSSIVHNEEDPTTSNALEFHPLLQQALLDVFWRQRERELLQKAATLDRTSIVRSEARMRHFLTEQEIAMASIHDAAQRQLPLVASAGESFQTRNSSTHSSHHHPDDLTLESSFAILSTNNSTFTPNGSLRGSLSRALSFPTPRTPSPPTSRPAIFREISIGSKKAVVDCLF